MNLDHQQNFREDIRNWITAAAKMFVAAVLLGESFHATTRALSHWLPAGAYPMGAAGPAVVHALLLVLAISCGLLKISDCFPRGHPKDRVLLWSLAAGVAWPMTLAAAAVISGHFSPGARGQTPEPGVEWWVTSVLFAPVMEELVYRGLFASRFRARHGYLAGSYFAAVLFAWVHSWPSLAEIMRGQFGGVPPGPLLLALTCDWLYVRIGSLWPAIAFHAACNATPAIFAMIDPRWLKWFGVLYQ